MFLKAMDSRDSIQNTFFLIDFIMISFSIIF